MDEHPNKPPIKPEDLRFLAEASRDGFARAFDTQARLALGEDAPTFKSVVQSQRLLGKASDRGAAIAAAFAEAEAARFLPDLVDRLLEAGLAPAGDEATAALLARAKGPRTSVTLQALTDAGLGFLDAAALVQSHALATIRTCRIYSLLGRGAGSGFLVGPETVLTNWHVVLDHLEADRSTPKADLPARLRVEFPPRFGDGQDKAPVYPVVDIRPVDHLPIDVAAFDELKGLTRKDADHGFDFADRCGLLEHVVDAAVLVSEGDPAMLRVRILIQRAEWMFNAPMADARPIG